MIARHLDAGKEDWTGYIETVSHKRLPQNSRKFFSRRRLTISSTVLNQNGISLIQSMVTLLPAQINKTVNKNEASNEFFEGGGGGGEEGRQKRP